MTVAIQQQFISGEVSPRFHKRTDLEVYKSSLQQCFNMYPVVSGAVTRRPAVQYFAETKFPTQNSRPYSFIFNNAQAILLEFGNLYVRFHAQSGTILSSGTPYEVVTPYTAAQVNQLRMAQINDVIYIVHPSHAPRRLIRLADNNWLLETIAFLDGPFEDTNTTSTTMTISGSAPAYTITASASAFASPRDVGRAFRFQNASTGVWIWGAITAVSSATVATFTPAPSQAAPTGNSLLWRWGAFYSNNYPSQVVFHSNRLVFANTPTRPSSGWISMLNNLERFSPSSTVASVDNIGVTNGISFTLASRESSTIVHLTSDTALLVGTESGMFASNIDTLTPANFQIVPSGDIPLSSVQPLKVDGRVLVINRLRNKVYALVYSNETRGYVSQDVSLYWEHLLDRNIANMAYVSSPTPLIWFVMDDGSLLSMTYLREQNIVAFAQHEIQDTVVNRLAVLPNFVSGQDVLWMDATVNNNRRIGTMAREYSSTFSGTRQFQDARYLDWYLVFEGVATDTFTGATIYANRTVYYLADGRIGTVLVNGSGGFTLPFEAENVVIGLNYLSQIQTLDLPIYDTASMYLKKRAMKIKLALHDSVRCLVKVLQSQASANAPYDDLNVLDLRLVQPTYVPSAPPISGQSQQIQVQNQYLDVLSGMTEAQSIESATLQSLELQLWTDEPTPLTILGIYCTLSLGAF